ncbi:MAG: RNA-binding cell elongation regulator Jag/EloR [Anaerolineae bacterium]|nr:protein jag [Anaerolineae bacterium]MDW8102900.1 RNA-binding cell elongation regulator Jag/EloR [Anaerolineae bacterium]
MTSASKSLEVTGSTVEEAINKGLAELGKSLEEVEIEVISEGKRGWFFLKSEPARVKIKVKEPLSVEEIAREMLVGLVSRMGFRARVTTRIGHDMVGEESEEPPLVLNLTGHDLSLLIGKKGEILSALQLLTRTMVSKRLGQNANIIVDVENYRARRWKFLSRLALRMAEKVERTHKTIVLEPMPPYERRIIHLALRNHPTVTTKSIGEGEKRRVTIFLKNQGQ